MSNARRSSTRSAGVKGLNVRWFKSLAEPRSCAAGSVFPPADCRVGDNPASPYGVLVVEELGLCPRPSSFVQIANIPDDGLSGLEPK